MLTLKSPPLPSSANENNAPESVARQIVRTFSVCGPCITEGKLVKRIAQFYVFEKWRGGDRFEGQSRIRCDKAHIDPCPSCRDHVRTHYPLGYMD